MENIMKSPRYAEALSRADEMLSKMTLTEKIGQLSQYGTSIYSDNEQTFDDHFAEGKVGSYLTIKGAARTNGIQRDLLRATRLPIPAMFADDVIHGYRTTMPTPLAQSCTWDPEVARRGAEVAAREAYRAGLKWTFSPMVDIARDPRWGRCMEGYGEDTYLCSRFSEATVKGYQGEGDEALGKDRLMACMKHFVAYGACIGGRDYNSADMSLQTLHDVYLPSFKAGIDAGAVTVMSAFEDLNGVPATGSRYLLTEVLREQMGFEGLIITDSLDMNAITLYTGDRASAVQAVLSGNDLLCCTSYDKQYPAVLDAVRDGTIPEEMIDNAVRRILALKAKTLK